MFGLVSASAWMHVRNGTFKMGELVGSESDSVPVSLLTFSAGREKVKSPKGRNSKLKTSAHLDERRRDDSVRLKRELDELRCFVPQTTLVDKFHARLICRGV